MTAWVFENACVRPLDGGRPRAAALAVADGRVLAIGDVRSVRRAAGPRAERIDCGGATVLPGLIDAHLHLLALAARRAHVDLSACTSVDAVLAAVRATTTDGWVRGEGLDESRLGRLPTRAELDRVAGGRPMRLRHRSRHASVLNTAALERLGGLPDVDGLVHGRETAVSRGVGPVSEAVLAAGLADVAVELARQGLTTVADATPRRAGGLAPLRRAIADGTFRLRVHAMRVSAGRPWPAHPRLQAGPVKILVEEGPGGMRPGPAALARRIDAAAASGAAVAVHCVGSATLVAALAAFAALPAARRRQRHRLEHLAECPPPLVARIARLGLTVVTNPSFVHVRGDVYRQETSRDAWPWLYRARSLMDAGIVVAAGSDAPIAPLSPWLGIATARRRRTASGAILGPAERLDAEGTLALYTRNAAHALGDDTLGRLVPGGPADLIVVEPDPLCASAAEVAATVVRCTMVDGEMVWSR
ncbi:MAG TPA: amidohydrolase family protein [Candidatus Binatia bacterium]|nr:amidohydrolase family protein [Candidatus Binatia bacterium]